VSDVVSELREHALMCANEVKRWNPHDSNKVEKAYTLANIFSGHHCPRCWVNDEKAMLLGVLASSLNTNYYRCERCKFSGVFPTPNRATKT